MFIFIISLNIINFKKRHLCRYEVDVEWRSAAGDSINYALSALMRLWNVSVVARLAVQIVVLVYISEIWVLQLNELKIFFLFVNITYMRSQFNKFH